MGIKCKLFNVGTTPASFATIKTPNQYSRLNHFQSAQFSETIDMGSKESGGDFTVKLMLLLDKSDLVSTEIEKKFNKVIYEKNPHPKLLTEEKLRAFANPKISDLIINKRTLNNLAQDLEKLQNLLKEGKPFKTITIDWLSAQSYAEDFMSVAMKNTSNTFHPLEEQILIDQNLGAIEEEVFDWNLKMCSKLVAANVSSSPRPQLVQSEVVSVH